MWLDNASQDTVNLFWQRCGELEPFPRNLERSVALALPLTIVKLPKLKLHDVELWLRRRGTALYFGCQSRVVRGCLIAFGGCGFIFIDGADPDDERRFTLAHEIAHFMIDYWQPRENAISKLGNDIVEVIDGTRSPTVGERVHALLGSIPIGLHTDLMERGLQDEACEVWAIENRADRIAVALLAPPKTVLSSVNLAAMVFEQRQAILKAALCDQFGLPESIATPYSRSLLTKIGKGPSWVESIRLG